MRRLISRFALVLAAGPAFAEPATPEGAKAMADAYAAYVSREPLDKGFLTIAPHGDDYVVTWDIGKAIGEGKPEAQAVTIAPFVYRITPTLGGGWLARADALPKATIEPSKPDAGDGGEVGFEGFRFEGLYDPAAPEFFRSKLALGVLNVDVKSKTGEQTQHIVLSENDVAGELRVKSGGDGAVDVGVTQSIASATSKSAVSGENAGGATESETRQGAATGDGALSGLRAAAIGDLWRFLVAHADSGRPADAELKPKFEALLPLWREFTGQAKFNDLSIRFPGSQVSLKSATQDVRMTGLVAQSSLAIGMAFEGLNIEAAAAPEWSKMLWPASLALRIEAGVDGLDHIAQMALADEELSSSGKLDDDSQDEIEQALLAGHPHVVVDKTRLTTPMVEATVEGEAKWGEEGPQAHARITADDLDKVLQAIAKIAETEPDAQKFVFLGTFVRGLAKTEDGRLVWDIDYVAPDSIKVNGQTFPQRE